MFELKKLVSIALLPPGLFVLAWALVLLLLGRHFQGKRVWLAVAGMTIPVALVWVLSIEPVSTGLLRPLEDEYPVWDQKVQGASCIVLLGGGILAGAPDQGGRPALALEAWRRAQKAAQIHRATGLPIVATGGVVFRRQGPTAPGGEVMRDALVDFGVPRDLVIPEVGSRDTHDNARFTAGILSNRGWSNRVLLVTSAYHMPRSVALFEKRGVFVVPVPTDYKVERGPAARHQGAEAVFRLLPQAKDLSRSAAALREWYGLLFYSHRQSP